MEKLLKDKVAIVTGAGRGIGQSVAIRLAEQGAKVVVNDPGTTVEGAGSDNTPARAVADIIVSQGGIAVPNYDSVSSMEGGERIVQTALDAFNGLDILVTCHGILRDRMIFDMSEEEWDSVINVHLKGTFTVVRNACTHFREQRSGRIITFTSSSGLYENIGQANYGAAKDGIAGFTRVVARDMGEYGVTVNSIAPSAYTRMFDSIPKQRLKKISSGPDGDDQDPTNYSIRGAPEDIAPFVTWLASEESSGINGCIFAVSSNLISLVNHPAPLKTIYKSGRWTEEELIKVFPSTLGLS